MAERDLVHELVSFEVEANSVILGNIGSYSYGTALLAYTMLIILIVIARRNNPLGGALLAASAFTALWAGTVVVSTVLAEPQILHMQLAEVARNGAWIFVLLKLLGLRLQGTDHILASNRWIPWFAASFCLIIATLLATEFLVELLSPVYDLSLYVSFGSWIAMSIAGLLLLEQFFRNSNEGELWGTKHLCLGLGILFVFDFFMYAEALLFRQLDRNLWLARGIVATMAAILMAVSISRTDRSEPKDNVRGGDRGDPAECPRRDEQRRKRCGGDQRDYGCAADVHGRCAHREEAVATHGVWHA